MALLDHIAACNRFDPARFVPLLHAGRRLGLLRRDNAAALKRFPDAFRIEEDAAELVAPGGFDGISARLDEIVAELARDGRVEAWRHEYFAIAHGWGEAPVCRIDRGSVGFFGTRSFGVHLNGWWRENGHLMLWIGRRAPDKKVAPGKLDNLVAGGIGFGHGATETLVKEAGEEAAIPKDLVARARPVGALAYRMEVKAGVRDDALFAYDLEVPPDFVPRNTDGEIAEFMKMPAEEALARVAAGDDFKFNVNLVIIDFAIRHGLLTPEHPDYYELVMRLRRAPA